MRKKKKFVIYYRREKFLPDPFADFGEKRDVHYALFIAGHKKGYDMFLSSGVDSYKNRLTFTKNLFFDGKKFVSFKGNIIADAILDRSAGLYFPKENISSKVLNEISFKKLCADKFATYKYLGELVAKTFLIKNQKDFQKNIKNFSNNELVVFKPVDGMQGKGIVIDVASNVRKVELEDGQKYILQKFVDTSAGIEGIVEGLHDLRVVIVGGEIVWCHVRRPKVGTYLANVALGGSIEEIEINRIPSYILDAVHKIQNMIDNKYNMPLYSIDFGVSDKTPYVFELNDQIGFPRASMKNKDFFIDNIIKSLERLSNC